MFSSLSPTPFPAPWALEAFPTELGHGDTKLFSSVPADRASALHPHYGGLSVYLGPSLSLSVYDLKMGVVTPTWQDCHETKSVHSGKEVSLLCQHIY